MDRETREALERLGWDPQPGVDSEGRPYLGYVRGPDSFHIYASSHLEIASKRLPYGSEGRTAVRCVVTATREGARTHSVGSFDGLTIFQGPHVGVEIEAWRPADSAPKDRTLVQGRYRWKQDPPGRIRTGLLRWIETGLYPSWRTPEGWYETLLAWRPKVAG